VGEVFVEVRCELSRLTAPSLTDAWASGCVGSPAEMNLNGWGPTGIDEQLQRFERALRFRFGWRRWVAVLQWHPGA
jgi:hypothetical protein